MKVQKRLLIIIGLTLLLLSSIVVFQWQSIEMPHRDSQSGNITPAATDSAQPRSDQGAAPAVSAVDSKEELLRSEQVRAARGSGYMWGSALNGVYAARTLTADGKWRLDVSELYRSFEGVVRPVHLEDATASPEARAEYLAAVITSALGLNTAEQPTLSGLLQAYYKADTGEGTQQEDQRTRISSKAREALLARLSPESQELFQTIFNTPDFLFRSMFIATDEIIYTPGRADSGVAFASGNARFTLGRDGVRVIDAESIQFEGVKARLRKADSGTEVQNQNP